MVTIGNMPSAFGTPRGRAFLNPSHRFHRHVAAAHTRLLCAASLFAHFEDTKRSACTMRLTLSTFCLPRFAFELAKPANSHVDLLVVLPLQLCLRLVPLIYSALAPTASVSSLV